jgi:FkbM family methyltransferase
MLWLQRIQHLKKNHNFYPKNILDIGACVGHFFDIVKQIWPKSEITMIEANSVCEPELKKRSNNYYISTLSDSIKNTIYYTNKIEKIPSGASLYLENTSFYSPENVIINHIQTNTLTNLLGYKNFDFIKLDTQGSEIDIIKGGIDIVKNAKYLLVESSITNYNLNAPLIKDLLVFLDSIDFQMIDIWNCHYANIVPGNHYDDLSQIDILFKNNLYE